MLAVHGVAILDARVTLRDRRPGVVIREIVSLLWRITCPFAIIKTAATRLCLERRGALDALVALGRGHIASSVELAVVAGRRLRAAFGRPVGDTVSKTP